VSTPDAVAASLRDRLRRDTRDLHEAAEHALDSARRLVDLPAYLDLLERLWSLHGGLTEAFAGRRLGGFDPAVASGRKSDALAADLADLGRSASALAPARFTFASEAEALGAAYVQIGSTLGGRVLFRQASDNLGVRSDHGGRFLAADEQVRRDWRLLLDELAGRPAVGAHADAALRGARQVFTAFAQRLAASSSLVGKGP
jgi:heme oxygenase